MALYVQFLYLFLEFCYLEFLYLLYFVGFVVDCHHAVSQQTYEFLIIPCSHFLNYIIQFSQFLQIINKLLSLIPLLIALLTFLTIFHIFFLINFLIDSPQKHSIETINFPIDTFLRQLVIELSK